MTRATTFTPRAPELLRITAEVDAVLREGRFNEDFKQDALRRVAAANGDFNDNLHVLEAPVSAGVIPSLRSVLNLKPTARWDPVTRKIVPL